MNKLERFWELLLKEAIDKNYMYDVSEEETKKEKIDFLLKFKTYENYMKDFNRQSKNDIHYNLIYNTIQKFNSIERKIKIDNYLKNN